jgi:hypothetical protein
VNDEARITFEATVDEAGHCKPAQVGATRDRLRKWKGRKVLVTVLRWVKPKTLPQLAFFHGPILEHWSDYTGYAPDEMKRELKLAWLPKKRRVSALTGEEDWYVPSLAELNAEEMSAFIDRCIKEGNLLGITFPDPKRWAA